MICHTWTLGVQHAFTNNLSLDVSYVGTTEINYPELSMTQSADAGRKERYGTARCTNEQMRRPYNAQFPYFGQILY